MTSYEKIYDRAAENYGYITTREAAELGVPKSEMSALAKRNRLVHNLKSAAPATMRAA